MQGNNTCTGIQKTIQSIGKHVHIQVHKTNSIYIMHEEYRNVCACVRVYTCTHTQDISKASCVHRHRQSTHEQWGVGWFDWTQTWTTRDHAVSLHKHYTHRLGDIVVLFIAIPTQWKPCPLSNAENFHDYLITHVVDIVLIIILASNEFREHSF